MRKLINYSLLHTRFLPPIQRKQFENRHYVAVLFVITFSAYYYIIFHGNFIILDDVGMINDLLNRPPLNLKSLFFPAHVSHYYRPLIALSYRLDFMTWFTSASGYYLTNIFLHVLNTFFVYVLGCALFEKIGDDPKLPAFAAAVLFAVNPLHSELICWVSGRSDLLAGVFALPSFIFYLKFRRDARYWYLFLSGAFYLCAIFAKEEALVLPGLIIAFELFSQPWFDKKNHERIPYVGVIFFVVLTMIYFLVFRGVALDTTSSRIGIGEKGLKPIPYGQHIETIFASIGFYIKKLFIPFPLNFAIHSINLYPYAIFGFIALLACAIWSLVRVSIFSFFISWVIIALVPAIMAAVLRIPWTQWAERYLYLPSIGFSLALGFLLMMPGGKRRISFALLIFLSGTLLFFTAYRGYVWADELRLWEDAVQKSDFGPVHYYYGAALLRSGKKEEGIVQMEKAILQGYGYEPYLALAQIKTNDKDYQAAQNILKKLINDYPLHSEVHNYIAQTYLDLAAEGINASENYRKAIEEYETFLSVRPDDVMTNYKVAQLLTLRNQYSRARSYLERVAIVSPDSVYGLGAKKILQKIPDSRGNK